MSKKPDVRTQHTAQQMAKNFSNHILLPEGYEFFKPKQDKRHKVDIIPYQVSNPKHPLVRAKKMKINDDWDYLMDFYIHKYVGAEDIEVLCPVTFGQKCPICEEYQKLRTPKMSKEEMEEIKNLKKKKRVMYHIYDYGTDKKYIFEESEFLFQQPLVKCANIPEDGQECVSLGDPDDVQTVKFLAVAGGMSDKYNDYESISLKHSERKYGEEKLLKKNVKLDHLLVLLDYDEIKEIFEGGEIGQNPATAVDKEDEKPSKSKKKFQDDEDDSKEEKKSESKEETSSGDCPKGHNYGKDWDEFENCDGCPAWEECAKKSG